MTTTPAHNDAQRLLSSYRVADRSLAMKLDELAHLRAVSERLARSAWAPGTPIQADITRELERVTGSLEQKVAELCGARRVVEAAIRTVEDAQLREILERRYLDAQTLEQIAEAMHYTNRHISRLHKRALEAVVLDGRF